MTLIWGEVRTHMRLRNNCVTNIVTYLVCLSLSLPGSCVSFFWTTCHSESVWCRRTTKRQVCFSYLLAWSGSIHRLLSAHTSSNFIPNNSIRNKGLLPPCCFGCFVPFCLLADRWLIIVSGPYVLAVVVQRVCCVFWPTWRAGIRMSSTETSEAGYAGSYLQRFKNYLKVSGEQAAVCSCVTKVLPEESKRYAQIQICFPLEFFFDFFPPLVFTYMEFCK